MVVVPTYNEVDNIPQLVGRLFDSRGERAVELLFVDDSSPDGTAWAVKAEQQDREGIHLIERPGREGLGSAYVAGFRWALERGYDQVVEMDADLSHDPADVPRLLDALDDADLVIGSRYVEGGNVVNWGRSRRALSKMGNVYARLWLGFEVRDATSGLRAFRASALGRIDLDKVRAEGYAFQIELARRVYKLGGTIKEIPIKFVDRTAGRSKMSRRIVIEAVGLVTAWGIRDRLFDRKSKRRAEAEVR
ncbi:MAG: polyprenol monophosphomannose synthase [Actinomycetota bacterium]|nr:polyprenol monophosphomannose synthase [Actinomycetota bacterium]